MSWLGRVLLAVALVLLALSLHPIGLALFAVAIVAYGSWCLSRDAPVRMVQLDDTYLKLWLVVSLAVTVMGHITIGALAGSDAISSLASHALRVILPNSFLGCLNAQLAHLGASPDPSSLSLYVYFTVVAPYVPMASTIGLGLSAAWTDLGGREEKATASSNGYAKSVGLLMVVAGGQYYFMTRRELALRRGMDMSRGCRIFCIVPSTGCLPTYTSSRSCRASWSSGHWQQLLHSTTQDTQTNLTKVAKSWLIRSAPPKKSKGELS